MQQNKKVQRVPKRVNINIGVIIFVIILIYTGLNVYFYITKPKVSIYEVTEQGLAQDNVVTGIITREEKEVLADRSGYVNYYFRDGAKIAKNSTVYSLDENKSIYEKLSDYSMNVVMSEDDINDVKNTIISYKKQMPDKSFSYIYDFKDDLSSKIQEVIDDNLLTNMESIINETGVSTSFEVVKSDDTGIISYYSDNYSGLQESGITSSIFDQTNYVRKNLRESNILEAGQPVYKLITDSHWTIIAPIDETLAEQLKDKKQISFTFQLDQVTVTSPISLYQDQNQWYLSIKMDRFVERYCKERFVELEINNLGDTGLKIPKTAICEKEFYLIPNSYLVKGGNTNEQGVMLEVFDEKLSEVVPTFTSCEVYYQDEEYSYVGKDTFEFNNYIRNIDTGDRFPISMVGKLEGVYNVNKGYAVFRRIERVSESSEYVIVKKGTSQGLSKYDHIALNAELVIEDAVIY